MLTRTCSLLALSLLLLLVGCRRAVEPAQQSQATATEPAVEDTAAPTEEPTATDTAVPPTSTPEPTATPQPTATVEPTPLATATATPDPDQLFHFSGNGRESAVIQRATSGSWDATYVNPGAVVFHDGQFHMFRNGFKAWPGTISVGYMTSPDGRHWQAVQDTPLFTSREIPYAANGAAVSSVVVADDGTWMLTFHTLDSPGVIGRLTAPAPEGPWTADPQPLLTPGGEGAWDRRGVGWHSVVRTEEEYVMYYAGSGGFTTLIGRATSPDGAVWTKYNDPATTDPLYAESDPVLTADQEWMRGDTDRPEARRTDEGWVMLYVGNDLNQRGLAFSEDGIQWRHHEANPVIQAAQFPLSGTTWDTALEHHDGAYYYFMEIGTLAGTDIYLATHEGSLQP